MPAHAGAESLKKPHHMATLRFSEVVNDHANYYGTRFFRVLHSWAKTKHIITLNTNSRENKVPENSKLDVMILNHPTVILGIGPCAALEPPKLLCQVFHVREQFCCYKVKTLFWCRKSQGNGLQSKSKLS